MFVGFYILTSGIFLNDTLYFRLKLKEVEEQLNLENNVSWWKIVCRNRGIGFFKHFIEVQTAWQLCVSQQCICSDMCPSFSPFSSPWMCFLQRAILEPNCSNVAPAPNSISFRMLYLAHPHRTNWVQACFHNSRSSGMSKNAGSSLKSFCSCVWAVINGWHKPLGTTLNGWTVPYFSSLVDFFFPTRWMLCYEPDPILSDSLLGWFM